MSTRGYPNRYAKETAVEAQSELAGEHARRARHAPSYRWLLDFAWPLPPVVPAFFPQSPAELEAQLAATDAEVAEILCHEAEGLFTSIRIHIENIERRATALQGTVAVATSFTLTGGTLVLFQATHRSHIWRATTALGLLCVVATLVVSALLSLGATHRIYAFLTPSDNKFVDRAKATPRDARIARTAYVLTAYAWNNERAELKALYLRRAGAALALALVFVVFVGTFLLGSVVLG